MTLAQASLRRTAEYWSTAGAWEPGRGVRWLELPAVQRRLNRKISGQPDVDWVAYTLDRYFAGRLPLGRCLSLGCGEGGLERELARRGAFSACSALDIAAGSVEKAAALAQQAGYRHIQYSVEDANQLQLPAEHFDAIWALDAVHHFERLEHVFAQVAAALRRDSGLFILYEYVGPSFFDFPPRQREVIQACHELLPARYRRLTAEAMELMASHHQIREWRWILRRVLDKLRDGDLLAAAGRRLRVMRARRSGERPLKTSLNLPSVRSVQALDPSEAVRSAEILPVLSRYFEIVELKPLGGTILQFLLADIAGNFADEAGERMLELLFAIEDELVGSGDLASDFAYIVAAPRQMARADRPRPMRRSDARGRWPCASSS